MSSSTDFVVEQVQTQREIAPGHTNDDAEEVLRKFLNPALNGNGWKAFLAALAAGDQPNWDNAALAFDQLYITSSSGSYLERRAGDQGETRPTSVGMSDELFRKLAVIKKTRKLTQEAFLEVLEVFYGSDAVRASSTTTAAEPFALVDQDTLVLLLDERATVQVTFNRSEFAQVGAALAIEIAGAISRALKDAGSQAYALAYSDPTTGGTYVRIYSGSLGLSSSVRVIGGSGQRALSFPTPIFAASDFSPTTWVATKGALPGHVRFTGGSVDLNKVRAGDLAYFFSNDPTDAFVVAGIQGVFPVAEVDTYYVVADSLSPAAQYFDILLPNAPLGSYAQTDFTGLMFFRPSKRTIYDQPRHVIVNQDGQVILPATTQAVNRQPGTAAYLNGQQPRSIATLTRTPDDVVTVATDLPHGLSVGDQVMIDGVAPTGEAPSIIGGTPSPDFSSHIAVGTTDASLESIASESDTVAAVEHLMVRTGEGLLMLVSGKTQTAPGSDTAIANPKVFEVTGDTVQANGGRQLAYKWTDLVTHTQTVGKRRAAASTLLDGRILVTGGTNSNTDVSGTPLNNWDLYSYSNSPTQNTQASGTMPAAVAGHDQCMMGTLALICGGWNSSATVLSSSATFDPSTNTWTSRGAMARARMAHRLVALNDGSALAIGGVDGAGKLLNVVERQPSFSGSPATYNVPGSSSNNYLGSGTWTFSSSTLNIPAGATIVVAGSSGAGLNGTYTVSSYNNTTHQASMTPLPTPPTGGRLIGVGATITVSYFAGWAGVGSMTYARRDFGAQLLPDGRVVVVGGLGGNATQNSYHNTLASCEIYDPSTGLWSPLPPMAVGRQFPIVSYIAARNAIFVAGGGSPVIEMLDIATMRWSKSLALLPFATTQPSGGLAAADAFVVVGGLENAHDTPKLSYIALQGSDSLWAGGLNRSAAVLSTPDGSSFTYKTSNNNYRKSFVVARAGATVTPMKALAAPAGIPGPFSFDTKTGLSVTKTVTTLDQAINGNQSYSTLDVADASAFPDQVGYVVLDFGFAGQVGPIKYLGLFDGTALLLDASFKFPKSVAAGVTVTLLKSNSPFAPPVNAKPLPGNFYVTGSAAGRVAAEAAIDDIAAEGIEITKTVLYPGDRGLGNEGGSTTGGNKLSDATVVWGGDDLDNEIPAIREGS